MIKEEIIEEIEKIIAEQFQPEVAEQISIGGGAEMVLDTTLRIIQEVLGKKP